MLVTLATKKMHVYEVQPRKDRRGVDLISDVLPFGRLVRRGECSRQRDRLRKVLQPVAFRNRERS
jgi:hypothetical protein